MGISANPIAIWLAALVGSVATAAFGQSSPVLMGAAPYGDWRDDAPGVRRKITPADGDPRFHRSVREFLGFQCPKRCSRI